MRAPRLSILAAAVIGGLSAVANASERSPLPAAREVPEQVRSLVQRFVDQVDALPGYQVVMTKQQRIGGTLSPAETLLLKQTRSPDCRYMKWIAEPNQGREVILCSDRYEGKIKVHEGGLLGIATLSLDPDGSLARQGNLRPIRQAGVYNMAAMLKADIQRRAASGTIDAPDTTDRDVDGQASLCLHRDGIGREEQNAPYPIGAAELCFDKALAMPTEVRFWHQNGLLMEHYRFRQWNLTPGLGAKDFDIDNPDYDF